ncbi:glycosyl hydrolase [Caballeronia hypogeia]|uniref:Glycosyl hydrolase n=1 Tax=Caballeronia hypogeia TaxID=1777140 RepID=A0A158CV40_9BURK|nr:YCF48-related protein [Caballeronia hypogeia]SAK86194.1 glycosyl hydrolase [Caballeronia hypogeia]
MLHHKYVARTMRVGLLGISLLTASWVAGAQVEQGSSSASQSGAAIAPKDPFVDPLDAPAFMHRRATGRPVMAAARAGTRIVAVGMRGLIIISDDEGKTWQQVDVPVRSDLLALSFPTARDGWAVGHDGVVLHTVDGGRSWRRQLDGRVAATTLVSYYKAQIAGGDSTLRPFLDQLMLNYRQGPSLPLLSVWFRDVQYGIAVGPFGMAIATEDGGKTWRPILDRFDNPQFLHLNTVFGQGDQVYVAAEKGTVFRLDSASGRFVAVNTGYAGSFFGMTGNDRALFAFGLRGTIYRSADHGMSWSRLPSPLRGAVTGGAPIASREQLVFVSAAGEAALYDEHDSSFTPMQTGQASVLTAVLPLKAGAYAVMSLVGPTFASTR